MCIGNQMTATDALLQAIGGIVGLALSIYWGRLAWTLTAEQFATRLAARRPYRFGDAPLYGPMSRWGDGHPRSIIWTVRLSSIVAVLFITAGLIYSLLVLIPGHMGVPPC